MLGGERQDVVAGAGAVGDDQQRDAALDHHALGLGTVAHHHHVTGLDARRAVEFHRLDPDATGEPAVLTDEQLALEHCGDRVHVGGLAQLGALA